MGFTSLDILMLVLVGGAAVLGWMRGFVFEVLALFAFVLVVLAVRLLHLPATELLRDYVGTSSGAATLAFVLVAGGTYAFGRIIANAIGSRTRNSILGPIDRVLGLGFGAVKALIIASLAFMLAVLLLDTWNGGPNERPEWMTQARSYPLLNATSASIGEFVDKRKRGLPLFEEEDDAPKAKRKRDRD